MRDPVSSPKKVSLSVHLKSSISTRISLETLASNLLVCFPIRRLVIVFRPTSSGRHRMPGKDSLKQQVKSSFGIQFTIMEARSDSSRFVRARRSLFPSRRAHYARASRRLLRSRRIVPVNNGRKLPQVLARASSNAKLRARHRSKQKDTRAARKSPKKLRIVERPSPSSLCPIFETLSPTGKYHLDPKKEEQTPTR